MKIKFLFSQVIFFLACCFFTQTAFPEEIFPHGPDLSQTIIEPDYDCFVGQNPDKEGPSLPGGGLKRPDQYFATIGAAINRPFCSKIYVYNGTYNEQLIIQRNLTLVGEDRDGVVIDGTGLKDPGVSIEAEGQNQVVLKNISVKNWTDYKTPNDYGYSLENGGGIAISLSNVQIENLKIKDNYSGQGGGIYISGNHNVVDIKNSSISNNQALIEGGGIFIETQGETSTLNIDNTTINNNSATYGGGIAAEGDIFITDVYLNITNNSRIEDNTCLRIGGGGSIEYGTLSLNNSSVTNNLAGDAGGGFYISSTNTTIDNSTISDNLAKGNGGGILVGGSVFDEDSSSNYVASTLSIQHSTFSGNQTLEDGGGLFLSDINASVTKSTFSENVSQKSGGGIALYEASYSEQTNGMGTVTSEEGSGFTRSFSNVTISNNDAQQGGDGIFLYRAEGANSTYNNSLNNVTIFNNKKSIASPEAPMKIKIEDPSHGIKVSGPASISVSNTIIAQHSSNCLLDSSTSLRSEGNNLSDDSTCHFNHSGDLIVADVLLGSLTMNGGNTMTHLPQSGSPAINNGNNETCAKMDQRGNWRYDCDIGSVECFELIQPGNRDNDDRPLLDEIPPILDNIPSTVDDLPHL